jgi:hypothetical protein
MKKYSGVGRTNLCITVYIGPDLLEFGNLDGAMIRNAVESEKVAKDHRY